MKLTNSRAIAATILAALEEGSGSLATHLAEHQELADYGLLQETCYGCCRWFYSLEYLVANLVTKPLRRKDHDLKCLLIVGLYQLRSLSTPDYAVINETVAAANQLGKSWGKSLVNAVLRNYLRRQPEFEQSLAVAAPAKAAAFPDWLYNELQRHWPQQLTEILAASNERPPMTLRVNVRRQSRTDALSALAVAGCPALPGQLAGCAVYLASPAPVESLPGFAAGTLSVQDEASQLVPPLLQLQHGLRVLDACAAPGGKTCHILESEPLLTECVALDIDAGRLNRISANLARLQLKAKLLVADAGNPSQWWDGKSFDRVLLDAPCSATGVIRRHPDIKLLRTPANVERLLQTQQLLLRELWRCLAPGGLLLYTTCSILRQENEDQIALFLESTSNAKYESITADWGVECRFGRQLLPGAGNVPDGFFYALLRKL
jgi:16S rRNA (cytosine967-C5)-methyltransferase